MIDDLCLLMTSVPCTLLERILGHCFIFLALFQATRLSAGQLELILNWCFLILLCTFSVCLLQVSVEAMILLILSYKVVH